MNQHRLLALWVGGLHLICAAVAAQTQSGKMGDTLITIPFIDPRSGSTVVARIGDIGITAREFLLSYEFGPSFVKHRPDSKRRYLEFMTYEKLLAQGALERGKQSDPQIIRTLAALEGDVATEELYKRDILRKVLVTDNEVNRAAQEERTTLNMRWLFSPEKGKAVEWDRLLRSGVSFDTLFGRQFADTSVYRADRMMEITAFRLLQRNRALAGIADTLPPKKPSIPIHAPDGWYIVQIDDIWRDKNATETALNAMRLDARRALTQMKADSLSDAYVHQLMLGENPIIQRRTFDILRAYLGWKNLPSETFVRWDLTSPFPSETDSIDYVHPKTYQKDTLVTLRHGYIRLGEFLDWYELRETTIRLPQSSPQKFFLSLEDLVWRMVRDKLLVDRAVKRRLTSARSVILQKEWWKEKMLYQEEKDSIMRTISWTDSMLLSYYNAHRRDYRDRDGTPLQFDRVREEVLRDWYEIELMKRMHRRIVELRYRHPVAVDDHALKEIEVDVENDPRAIEVYPVKKGGTFPHPAFPTIDHSWTSWN